MINIIIDHYSIWLKIMYCYITIQINTWYRNVSNIIISFILILIHISTLTKSHKDCRWHYMFNWRKYGLGCDSTDLNIHHKMDSRWTVMSWLHIPKAFHRGEGLARYQWIRWNPYTVVPTIQWVLAKRHMNPGNQYFSAGDGLPLVATLITYPPILP